VGSGLGERLLGATAFTILLAVHLTPLAGNAQSSTRALVSPSVSPSGAVQLKVRRLSDALELVIEGTGPGPQLVQSSSNGGWQGQLTTAAAAGLRYGPQRLSLPEAGLEQVSLSGSGTNFQIEVMSTPGLPMKRPVVSADGQNLILTFSAPAQASLQTLRPNLNQPGAVPQAAYAPPLQPRAVAPPLGDMAIGTMVLRNTSYVAVRGPRVTMTLRNAPARDALMTLAQMGGYGFVYVDEQAVTSGGSPDSAPGDPANKGSVQGAFARQSRPVSIAFVNENYPRAVNAVLLASGLTAKLEGNMILAGVNVGAKGFGPSFSKVYRLNQVRPEAAADYIANLGARITKTNTIFVSNFKRDGAPSLEEYTSKEKSVEESKSSNLVVQSYGAQSGPLLGLTATTDSRLGTITLVGDSALVAVAEQYLRQLDLRQRQVALSLKILDINLDNIGQMANSFAVRLGDAFIVNDAGQMLGSFGQYLPPTYAAPPLGSPAQSSTNPNPVAQNKNSGFSGPTQSPGSAYPNNSFYDFVRASINSDNTKVLASPTLILSENSTLLREGAEDEIATGSSSSAGPQQSSKQGITEISLKSPIGRRRANEGVVRVGTNVVTSYVTNTVQGAVVCTPSLSTAGLVLGARVEKIDDNGFVTFTLSPSISAVVDQEPAPTGCGSPLNILSIRSLDTGAVRVRDGQTLILTGVISDSDRSEVTKWPVLGDIPLVGQFFRGSRNNRQKRELVIMVTPKIINDEVGGVYGYGYNPSSPQVRQMMGQMAN